MEIRLHANATTTPKQRAYIQHSSRPAAELAVVAVPNPSETVRKYTGTPSVSEAAALLAAGADQTHLIIEKHKLRGPDGRNATVSIARIPQ